MSTQEPTPEREDAAGPPAAEPDVGVAAVPSPDEIDPLRRSIEESVDAGDTAGAALALSTLHPYDATAAVLDDSSPDVAADVLRSMEWKQASLILARMRDRKSVGSVIIYADDDGGLMSPEVAALRESATVHSALTSLRTTTLPSARLQQLFVVDATEFSSANSTCRTWYSRHTRNRFPN